VTGATSDLTSALSGAQSLVIAVGFVPGNPLKMNAAAHEVDNVGTCKLIVSYITFLCFIGVLYALSPWYNIMTLMTYPL